MKRLAFGLFLILCIGCAKASLPGPASGPKSLDFRPPQSIKFILTNGLAVHLIKDSELPLISGSLNFPGGSLYGDTEKIGLMSAVGSQMREGGAGERSAEELDQVLEQLSAEISSGFGDELGSISFSCLSSDIENVLPIFADVVLRPRFESARLNLWKKHSLESIRRRRDNDETVLFIAAKQLLWGDSMRGRVARSSDVKNINRIDLLRAHRRFVVPNKAILSIAGDIDREQLEPLLEKYFAAWQASKVPLPPIPEAPLQSPAGIYFIELPFKQAGVVAAQLGVARHSPDQFAIDIFNEVFGGGSFDSHLVESVREKLGLAYVVYGQISPAVPRGTNVIFFQTDGAKIPQALQASLDVLRSFQSAPISEAELQDVKRSIKDSYVFKFDQAYEIVTREAVQKLLGFAPDFDAHYLDQIEAVAAKDLVSLAERVWDPQQFVVVVVGDKNAYNSMVSEQSVLSKLGLKSIEVKRLQFDETVAGL